MLAGQRAALAGPDPVHHRNSEQLLRAEEEVRVSQRRVEGQLGHEQGLLNLFFENNALHMRVSKIFLN